MDYTGWWKNTSGTRIKMEDLHLWFNGQGRVAGHGMDKIRPFVVDGWIRDGAVYLAKQYFGAFTVDYIGELDGEGAFFGTWNHEGLSGDWYMRSLREPLDQSIPATVDIVSLPAKTDASTNRYMPDQDVNSRQEDG